MSALIRGLLITGENNHDWRKTSPHLKKLLEQSGLFQIDLTEHPDTILEMKSEVEKYELFVLDYNGKEWSQESKTNFIEAVRAGTGVSVIHASNNAFPDWQDYREMIGMYWQHQHTGHGDYEHFSVNIDDHEHPVTRSLSSFSTWDQLTYRMMPTAGCTFQVLASAYARPENKGTGQYEPMIIVKTYGKARIFHTNLGHVWHGEASETNKKASLLAMESEGFQSTLLRGSEWAARGSVTENE